MSGFARMPGDTGDARHINLVLEHWFRVFTGEAAWRSPNFFFPQPATLGYSEALFLCALPYSLLRLLGVGIYSAFQGVLIWLSAVGYTAMYVLLYRTFGCRELVAALVASSVRLLESVDHAHGPSPPGHRRFRARDCVLRVHVSGYAKALTGRLSCHGVVGSMLMAFFLYTCFNVAWFVMLFRHRAPDGMAGTTMAGRRAATSDRGGGSGVLAGTASSSRWPLSGCLTPFVATYVPVWRELGAGASAMWSR